MAMDVERFRQVLVELREARVGTQKALSALTKVVEGGPAVNAMTISEIETGAIANPRILTVARLIEAMPNTTLSEFFARIEGLPMAELTAQDRKKRELAAMMLPVGIDDEALSALAPKDVLRIVVALAKENARLESEASGRPPHEHRPAVGAGSSGLDHRPRAHRKRVGKGRVKPVKGGGR